MNILELLQTEGIQPVQVTGGEWHSPCPFCGGKDRFSIQPEKRNSNGLYLGGRGICRQCQWAGDAVAIIMKTRGVSFKQAIIDLQLETNRMPVIHHTEAPKPIPGEWSQQAGVFLTQCQERLSMNDTVMQWLQQKRGLRHETVRAAGLGWNDRNRYFFRESWGLEPLRKADGQPKKLWLAKGVIIPMLDESGQVIRLRARRTETDNFGRYVCAAGSSMQPLTLWPADQRAVCLVESELDAILIQQEAGNVIGTVAMGSAQAKPCKTLHERLTAAEVILVSLDADEAGMIAAWKNFSQYKGFKRWPPLFDCKDPGDMYVKGIPINLWIYTGLNKKCLK